MDSKAWQLRLDESDKKFSVEGLEGWDQDLMYAKRSGVFQALSGMLCIDLARAESDLEKAKQEIAELNQTITELEAEKTLEKRQSFEDHLYEAERDRRMEGVV